MSTDNTTEEVIDATPGSAGLEEFEEATPTAAPADAANDLEFLVDVPLRLTVEIGSSKLLLREVLQLGKGSVIELDRDSGEPADVFVNGRLIARGDVTSIDNRLAVRIVELVRVGDGERRS